MTCEQFGRQACAENDQTADRIGLMLDRGDPRQAADMIRQELYDRPQPLQIDLLQRIQQYDQVGSGADLRIDPVVRRVQDQWGGNQYIDTGEREVLVDSEYGRETVAIIRGGQSRQYPVYEDTRRIDPLAAITQLFVGALFNGQFERWNHHPRRNHWQDQMGQMWYPQPGGRWGNQMYGPSQFYQGIPRQFSQQEWLNQMLRQRQLLQQQRDWQMQPGSPEWQRWQRQQEMQRGSGWQNWQQRPNDGGRMPEWMERRFEEERLRELNELRRQSIENARRNQEIWQRNHGGQPGPEQWRRSPQDKGRPPGDQPPHPRLPEQRQPWRGPDGSQTPRGEQRPQPRNDIPRPRQEMPSLPPRGEQRPQRPQQLHPQDQQQGRDRRQR